MKNKEHWKHTLDFISRNNILFGVDKDNKPFACSLLGCGKCIFLDTIPCKSKRENWLEQEHNND